MEKDYAKDFAIPFVLDPRCTALLVIDMQYASACRHTGLGKLMIEKGQGDLVAYRFGRIEEIVVPNIQKLLSYFRANKLRVIYLTIGSEMPDYSDIMPHKRPLAMASNNRKGQREHEVLDEIKPLPEERVVNKLSSGAFNSSNIDIILKAMGIKYLVYGGVSTNVCIDGTARDAADRGYRGIVVEDACGSTNEGLHKASLDNFKRFMGRVQTAEEVIAELSSMLNNS